MKSGLVTIHNTKTEETHRIQKDAPAWCLTFIYNVVPTKGPASNAAEDEMVVIGLWNKTMAFHKILPDGNTKVHVERSLKYYPCSMNTANSGNTKNQYLLVSGSNKKLCLYSKDGVQLSELVERDGWILANANQRYGEKMLIGTNTGYLEMSNVTSTVCTRSTKRSMPIERTSPTLSYITWLGTEKSAHQVQRHHPVYLALQE